VRCAWGLVLLTLELCGNRQVECAKHQNDDACSDAGCCYWDGTKCLPSEMENDICDRYEFKPCDSQKKCHAGYFCAIYDLEYGGSGTGTCVKCDRCTSPPNVDGCNTCGMQGGPGRPERGRGVVGGSERVRELFPALNTSTLSPETYTLPSRAQFYIHTDTHLHTQRTHYKPLHKLSLSL
jgi:hypothetical protein